MIHHSKPSLDQDDLRAITECFTSEQLAAGEITQQLEREWSVLFGGLRSFAFSSGGASILALLHMLQLNEGDEILLPAYICRQVLDPIIFLKLRPVFYDLTENFSPDYLHLRSKISSRSKLLIINHYFGMPVYVRDYINLRIPILEDCAHTPFATINGCQVGTMGDFSIFSFEATKYLTGGEGGMLVVNGKFAIGDISRYHFPLSNIQSALVLNQLKKRIAFIAKRKEIAEYYNFNIKNFRFQHITSPDNIYFRYILRDPQRKIDSIIDSAIKHGIKINKPVDALLTDCNNLPNTRFLFETTFSLPIYPGLTSAEQEEIVCFINNFSI